MLGKFEIQLFCVPHFSKPLCFSCFRSSNLSQALIDELLSSWVAGSIQKYENTTKNSTNSVPSTGKTRSMDLKINSEQSTSQFSNSISLSTDKNSGSKILEEERPLGDAPDPSEPHTASIFTTPPVRIDPDWGVVLGTFDHYDDNNWENFLIQSGKLSFNR